MDTKKMAFRSIPGICLAAGLACGTAMAAPPTGLPSGDLEQLRSVSRSVLAARRTADGEPAPAELRKSLEEARADLTRYRLELLGRSGGVTLLDKRAREADGSGSPGAHAAENGRKPDEATPSGQDRGPVHRKLEERLVLLGHGLRRHAQGMEGRGAGNPDARTHRGLEVKLQELAEKAETVRALEPETRLKELGKLIAELELVAGPTAMVKDDAPTIRSLPRHR